MGVPTLISRAGTPDSGNHRILATLEGRSVSEMAQRRPQAQTGSKGAAGLLVPAIVLALGGGLAWHFWPAQPVVHSTTAQSSAGVSISSTSGAHVSESSQLSHQADGQPETEADEISPVLSSEAAAAIIEEWVASGQASLEAGDGGNMRNPLATLAQKNALDKTDATQAQGALGNEARTAVTNRLPNTGADAGASVRKPSVVSDGRVSVQDEAVLASLMALGLPESNLAGVSVTQEGSVRVRMIPLDQVAARLKQCDAQGFFQRPLCRARVCQNVSGSHPECPAAWEAGGILP